MTSYLPIRAFMLLILSMLLTACGGGQDPVTGVTAPGLRYTGSLTLLTLELSGNALDNSVNVYANNTKCTVATATSNTARSASCLIVVPASLQLPVRITSASDYTVYSTTLTVPAPQVTFKTTLGDFVMELDPSKAPITVKNFLGYVNKSPSFYNSTIFHRVEPSGNFVVQGGGFTSGMVTKSGQSTPIVLESNNGLKNLKYSVGMARSTAFNSATSQFYVNLRDNTSFDYVNENSPGYAVFGKVVSGMEVIDTIATKPTHTVGVYANVPVTDITVTSATQTQ